jgi:hypothetical protein
VWHFLLKPPYQIGVSMRLPNIAFAWQRDVILCLQMGNMSMLGDCPNLSSSHPVSQLLQFFKLFNEPAHLFNRRTAENLSNHYPAPSKKRITVALANPPLQLKRQKQPLSARPYSSCTATPLCPHPKLSACEFLVTPWMWIKPG